MDQVESLCAVLSDEARLWDEVAALLRQEQRAVVELRPGTLLACLEERQALQEEVLALAARRRQLVQDVARRCGTDTERATVLIPLLPSESQDGLRTRLANLRRALLTARGLERQHARLLAGSLDGVNEIIAALRQLVPGARYDAGARMAVPPMLEQVDRRA
jgi:hypothetical protein